MFMGKELKVVLYGDPVLRKKAAQISVVNEEILELVSDMEHTVRAQKGIGLAAPQVGRSLAIFVTDIPELKEGKWVQGDCKVFLNPRLKRVECHSEVESEGCLSIPGIYLPVERPFSIHAEWMDLEGNMHEDIFHGLEARCMMHENDHLNGVLIIDRTDAKHKNASKQQLKKIQTEAKKKRS